jgi:hypothetical protein
MDRQQSQTNGAGQRIWFLQDEAGQLHSTSRQKDLQCNRERPTSTNGNFERKRPFGRNKVQRSEVRSQSAAGGRRQEASCGSCRSVPRAVATESRSSLELSVAALTRSLPLAVLTCMTRRLRGADCCDAASLFASER